MTDYSPFKKGKGGPGVPLPKEPVKIRRTGTPMRRPMIVAIRIDGVVTGRRREDLVKRWLEVNQIPYTAINKQVGDETVLQASEQVIADIYIGNHYVNIEQGHWVPAVHAIQARLHELIETRDRIAYDW